MNNEDMSGVFEKLNSVMNQNNISPDMVNNLLTMFGNNANNNNFTSTPNTSSYNEPVEPPNSNAQNQSSSGIDIETLLKMKSIIEAMNVKDDPRANLLMSLKPYLKDSRREKLDQYVGLMNMSKVIDFLPFMGGGKKNNG